MKSKLLLIILTIFTILFLPKVNFGQVINLGSAADYALFTTTGAVTNAGIPFLTHITGNVGTNSDPTIPGFGNVDGVMTYVSNPKSAQCAADLLLASGQIASTVPTFFPSNLLGNGQILVPGVYSIPSATTLNLTLILDGQNNPNSVFIFQIKGPLSTSANSKVKLINGALACNVFWKVDGLVDMASGTTMRGTVIANNAAIMTGAGDTLEGRALSINGAVTVTSLLAYTPIGCGSPNLTGPAVPALASAACYALFSSIGQVTDDGGTFVNGGGDVGNNGGGVLSGFDPLKLTGSQHSGDPSTAQAAADLNNAYNNINALPYDIELLRPDLFGHNLVLTPHTYLMLAAVSFTDTLYLNAEGNSNAVFVIKVNGAFSTNVGSKVVLINGAKARNVFWKIDGAIDINDNSVFNGTIIGAGAINLKTGVKLNGKALTINGALKTYSMTVNTTPGCNAPPTVITSQPNLQKVCLGGSASFSVTATGVGISYQWRKGSINLIDGANISGANNSTLTINPVSYSDTSSFYNVIVEGAPNDTSKNVALIINASPKITSGPSNRNACAGSSASFFVTATGAGLTYQWRKGLVNLINGANISGAKTDTLTINSVAISDTSSFYNVVIIGTCLPNDTSKNVSLKVNPPTGVPVFTAGATAVCQNAADETYTATAANSTSISYAVLPLAAGVINPNTGVMNWDAAFVGTATITATATGLCGTTSTDRVVTVKPMPTAIANSNSPVCIGTPINLTAQTVVNGTYDWAGPNGYTSMVQNPTIPSAALVNAGNYSLTVLLNGCTSAPSNTVVVVNNCNDLSIVKTVNNTTPIIGHNVIFTLVATNYGPNSAPSVAVTDVLQNGYKYVSSSSAAGTSYDPLTSIWTIGTLNNGASVTLTITAEIVANGNYVNTAIIHNNDVDGNMANNVSTIETFPTDFFIPEGFSPNGDGINDVFFIRGINNYPNNTFTTFNRWGNKVFETSSYKNTWDGKANTGLRIGGDDLPVGTYFYVLDLGDGSPVLKGTIYMNR